MSSQKRGDQKTVTVKPPVGQKNATAAVNIGRGLSAEIIQHYEPAAPADVPHETLVVNSDPAVGEDHSTGSVEDELSEGTDEASALQPRPADLDLVRLRNDFLYFVKIMSPNQIMDSKRGAANLVHLNTILAAVEKMGDGDRVTSFRKEIASHKDGVLSPVMIKRCAGKSQRLTAAEWAVLVERVEKYRQCD